MESILYNIITKHLDTFIVQGVFIFENMIFRFSFRRVIAKSLRKIKFNDQADSKLTVVILSPSRYILLSKILALQLMLTATEIDFLYGALQRLF